MSGDIHVHGGGTVQLFPGTPEGEPFFVEKPEPVAKEVTDAADKMLTAIRAGIALMIPEWGGRTWDELERAVVWWQRAQRIFGGKFDMTWESVCEPAIHPRNAARALVFIAHYPASVDGNMTKRRAYPRSYATKIGEDGRGLAEAIRSLIESACVAQ